jgi:serine/threonine protein phosphatase PrpC
VAKLRAVASPALRAAARTHPGRVRPTNEDVPIVDAARGVFGVIDGIGGHAGGEVAAAMAKDVILQRLSRPLGTPAERAREAIAIANNTIFRLASERSELAGMACVITLAIVADGRLTIGHVGDTRLYKLRGDGMRKLTRDHSPVGEREDAGELSEADAMRHPHRNEVFRDVGTIFRDKDEQEFVDVIDEPLEADAAILLCSDGLSDMLPGASIAHIVRQHAGDPEQVVEALVAAANDAGGRDNITVVYGEMPRFAEAVARGIDQRQTPTEPSLLNAYTEANTTAAMHGNALHTRPAGNVAGSGAKKEARPDAKPVVEPDARREVATPDGTARGSWIARAARAIVSSRMIWFTAGALGGAFGAIAWTAYVASHQVHGAHTLIVGPGGVSAFSTITAALAAARPGDVVRVEPGLYREQVEVGDGIDLVARVPGTVSILPPASGTNLPPASNPNLPSASGASSPATPALSITGALNVRVAGIRIESQSETLDTAVHITAPAATLELVEIAGRFRRAFVLSPASSVNVRGSRISVTDAVLAVPDDSHATFADSILTRTAKTVGSPAGAATGTPPPPALSMSASAHLVLRGNVFAGFGTRIVDGVAPAQRAELLAGNIVVPGEDFADGVPAAPAAGVAPAAGAASAAGGRRRGTASHQVPESGR